jgi:hypothetical protein
MRQSREQILIARVVGEPSDPASLNLAVVAFGTSCLLISRYIENIII